MEIDKKAKELMEKHPDGITTGQLQIEVPDEHHRQAVLGRMMYLAHENEDLRFLKI